MTISMAIAVVSLAIILGGAATMWFLYVRRNDPDRMPPGEVEEAARDQHSRR